MRSALAYQPELFAEEPNIALTHARFNGRSGAFGDNMSLPVHRWYRYSAGFSADWVSSLIHERRSGAGPFSVLDPFAGVGTTILASEAAQVQSWGFETPINTSSRHRKTERNSLRTLGHPQIL